MKNRTRTTFAALLSLLLGAAAAGCASQPLPNGAGECQPSFDNPHESHSKPGYIDGKTKIRCTFTSGSILTDLSITTKLQQQEWHGGWSDVAGSENTTTKATAKSGVTYTGVSGFIPCRKGTFRTAGRGAGKLNGTPRQSTEWGYGNAVTNPCG